MAPHNTFNPRRPRAQRPSRPRRQSADGFAPAAGWQDQGAYTVRTPAAQRQNHPKGRVTSRDYRGEKVRRQIDGEKFRLLCATLGYWLLELLAFVGALLVGGALWYVGAQTTLIAFGAIGFDFIAAWPWQVQLGLCALISGIELAFWPDEWTLWVWQLGKAGLVLALVGLFDLGTSTTGSWVWLQGRALPGSADLVLPTGGTALGVLALVAGLVVTFLPERIIKWALFGFLNTLIGGWNGLVLFVSSREEA